jgi:hypothetical protein
MPDLLQKTLRVVPALGASVSAPPVLQDSGSPTVAVLMRVDEQQVHSLIFHCAACDVYNSTDD